MLLKGQIPPFHLSSPLPASPAPCVSARVVAHLSSPPDLFSMQLPAHLEECCCWGQTLTLSPPFQQFRNRLALDWYKTIPEYHPFLVTEVNKKPRSSHVICCTTNHITDRVRIWDTCLYDNMVILNTKWQWIEDRKMFASRDGTINRKIKPSEMTV